MNLIRPIDISGEILSGGTVLQQPLLAVVFTPDLILTEPQSEHSGRRVPLHPPAEADLLVLRPPSQVDNPRLGPDIGEAESEEKT